MQASGRPDPQRASIAKQPKHGRSKFGLVVVDATHRGACWRLRGPTSGRGVVNQFLLNGATSVNRRRWGLTSGRGAFRLRRGLSSGRGSVAARHGACHIHGISVAQHGRPPRPRNLCNRPCRRVFPLPCAPPGALRRTVEAGWRARLWTVARLATAASGSSCLAPRDKVRPARGPLGAIQGTPVGSASKRPLPPDDSPTPARVRLLYRALVDKGLP